MVSQCLHRHALTAAPSLRRPRSLSFLPLASPLPFLTGTKHATDTLWVLSIPPPSTSRFHSHTSLVASPCMHAQYGTGEKYSSGKSFLFPNNIFPGNSFLFPKNILFPNRFLRHCPSSLPYLALLMFLMPSLFCILTGPLVLLSCLSSSLPFVPAGWLLSPVSLLKLSSKILPSRSPRPQDI